MGLSSYTVNQRKLMRSVQELRNYLLAVMKRIDKYEDKKPKFVKATVKDVQGRIDAWFLGRRRTIKGIEERVEALEKEIQNKW
jgi:hypothetical protein